MIAKKLSSATLAAARGDSKSSVPEASADQLGRFKWQDGQLTPAPLVAERKQDAIDPDQLGRFKWQGGQLTPVPLVAERKQDAIDPDAPAPGM